MPAVVPMFVSGMADQVAAIAVKSLAVAGGFLAGYAAGGMAGWALDRWVLAQKAPEFLKKAVRVVSGLAVALLVAMIVFGDGSGGGLFGGSGTGPGSGTTTSPTTEPGKQTEPPSPIRPEPKPTTVETPRPPEVKPDAPRVRVTFLGGDAVQGDRFYLLNNDTLPKSFDELKAAILKRKEGEPRQMYLLVQFPSDPRQRIDENSINVTQVTSWARNEAGLEVVLSGKK